MGALGWSVAGVLVALLLLRAVHLDERSALLLAASTGLPVVLALAWPLLLVAAVTGRLTPAVVAALLALVDAALLGPLLTGGRGPGPGGMPVRLLHLNVRYDVDAGASVATQVGRSEADVVVLTELSALSLRHLRLPQYAHAAVHERDDGFGGGIWSRWPLDAPAPTAPSRRCSVAQRASPTWTTGGGCCRPGRAGGTSYLPCCASTTCWCRATSVCAPCGCSGTPAPTTGPSSPTSSWQGRDRGHRRAHRRA